MPFAAPFPIERLPRPWESPETPASRAIACLIATSEITSLECSWLREVCSLRVLNDQRETLLIDRNSANLVRRLEAAESGAIDSLRAQQAAVEALRRAEVKLSETDDALHLANRVIASLQEELKALRGPRPAA